MGANQSTASAALVCQMDLRCALGKLENLRKQCLVDGTLDPARVKPLLVAGAQERAKDMGPHAKSAVADLSELEAVQKFNDLHAHLLFRVGCCHFILNEWEEAGDYLARSLDVPASWRSREDNRLQSDVRRKTARAHRVAHVVVAASRRQEVVVGYRAELSESVHNAGDFEQAGVKHHLAVVSYAGADTADSEAVNVLCECIQDATDATDLCEPAVLASQPSTAPACDPPARALDIDEGDGAPDRMCAALGDMFAVRDASLVDVLFPVTHARVESTKSQKEREGTTLIWRSAAVFARCDVLQFISTAVVPGDSDDAQRFDADLVLQMLQELTGAGASPPGQHDLYVRLDDAWLPMSCGCWWHWLRGWRSCSDTAAFRSPAATRQSVSPVAASAWPANSA